MPSDVPETDFPFSLRSEDGPGSSTALPPEGGRRRSRKRVAAILLGLLLLVVGGLWAAGWAAAGAGVEPGTTVLGVDIGGRSHDQAAAALEAGLASRAAAPIAARVGASSFSIDPAAAGLSVDTEATLANTGGRDWRPDRLWHALFGQKAVSPVVRVDRTRFDSALATAAAGVERPARDGDVVFTSSAATAVAPIVGQRIDKDAAASLLQSAFLRSTGPVDLQAVPQEPAVDAAEVQRALTQFARPAVSAPVTVTAAGRSVQVPVRTVAAALSMTPDSTGRLQPALDGALLARGIERLDPRFVQPAQNARLRVVDGRPIVVPAETGRSLDPKALSAAVLKALPLATKRVAVVPMTVTQPAVTTQQIAGLGVREVVSEYTQTFPYAPYREHNIGRAARYINGTMLSPGETFSMNDTVKERTEANGYVKGTVISEGRFREELGGGVSTITSAVWTAAFYAGLERVEQRAHSFYISRYKAGLEATVAYPTLDLKFRNDTSNAVLIQAESGDDFVTIRIWGTKIYDRVQASFSPRRNVEPHDTIYDPKPDCVEQPGEDGFDISVTRRLYRGGEVVKTDTYPTHYNPAAQIYCRAEPGSSSAR